jgi:hypothetical protein
MKIETSKLTGAALDWAVAKCEDYCAEWLIEDNFTHARSSGTFKYSTDWSQGGPITERERIETRYDRTGRFSEPWLASTLERMITGPTPLIAAMRSHVASKMGEWVDVPDELIEEAA